MTSPATSSEVQYVLTLHAVRRAINALKPLRIHETFPVYLHLRRKANVLRRFTGLQPDWQGEPHEWLRLPGGPPNKSHFRPFTSRGSSIDAFWMSDNLAGSYAPSSLRGMRTLYVDAEDEYFLPTRASGEPDAGVIRQRLLSNSPIPAWAVAAFIFRDRRFVSDVDAAPGWSDLLDVFQSFFDWTGDERDQLFDWSAPSAPAFELEQEEDV